MKRILGFWLIWLLFLIGTAGAIELVRQKNIATYVYFPITNTSGDVQTGCVTDTEIDAFADGSAPDGFADCTNEATEVGTTGWYYLSLTNTEMNNDYVALRIQIDSGCTAVSQRILIRTMVGDPLNNEVSALTANTITASAIATDAIGASEIADSAIDRATFSAESGLRSVRGATLPDQTGMTNVQVKLDASANANDNFYNNQTVYIISGTGVGQSRKISDYDGTNKIVTVDTAWVTQPATSDGFAVMWNYSDEILDEVVDSTYTLKQILRMQDAVLFGESSGGGTSTIIFRNVADSQDEITATVDANGNRTGMSYAGSP